MKHNIPLLFDLSLSYANHPKLVVQHSDVSMKFIGISTDEQMPIQKFNKLFVFFLISVMCHVCENFPELILSSN